MSNTFRMIFERCRKYGISLNPKKSIFGIDKGKLLGHIVSKDGIFVNPSRIEAIKRVLPPKNKKYLQSFFGKINLIRRFIPNFAEIVKPMNPLLKKDALFRWDNRVNKYFENIKEEIIMAPSLLV
jgi:hypothetical protein